MRRQREPSWRKPWPQSRTTRWRIPLGRGLELPRLQPKGAGGSQEGASTLDKLPPEEQAFRASALPRDDQPVARGDQAVPNSVAREQVPTDRSAPPPKDNRKNPPRSDNVPAGESSSKQTQIDVSPPADDAKKHPEAGLGNSASDADEFTPYNPMRAMKDVEIGDFDLQGQAELSRRHQPLPRGPGVQASRRRGHVQAGGGVE